MRSRSGGGNWSVKRFQPSSPTWLLKPWRIWKFQMTHLGDIDQGNVQIFNYFDKLFLEIRPRADPGSDGVAEEDEIVHDATRINSYHVAHPTKGGILFFIVSYVSKRHTPWNKSTCYTNRHLISLDFYKKLGWDYRMIITQEISQKGWQTSLKIIITTIIIKNNLIKSEKKKLAKETDHRWANCCKWGATSWGHTKPRRPKVMAIGVMGNGRLSAPEVRWGWVRFQTGRIQKGKSGGDKRKDAQIKKSIRTGNMHSKITNKPMAITNKETSEALGNLGLDSTRKT